MTEFAKSSITVSTAGRGLYEITSEVDAWVRGGGLAEGLLTLFIRHTSASLTIQENADPRVLDDLDAYFSRLVADGDDLFSHTSEGPDDMAAHVRSALTQTSVQVPVTQGRLSLGTWQGIFVFEHRFRPHRRQIDLVLLGS